MATKYAICGSRGAARSTAMIAGLAMTLAGEWACVPSSRQTGGASAYLKLRELVDLLQTIEGGDADPSAETDQILSASFQPGIPDIQTSPMLKATSSPVVLAWEGIHSGDPTVLAQGENTLIADASTGIADQTIELTENGVTRTLAQTISQSDGTLTALGMLTIEDAAGETRTLRGGWVFSQGDGTRVHPDSDPGFHAEVAEMLHVTGGDEAAPGLNLTLILVANTAAGDIFYLLDALVYPSP